MSDAKTVAQLARAKVRAQWSDDEHRFARGGIKKRIRRKKIVRAVGSTLGLAAVIFGVSLFFRRAEQLHRPTPSTLAFDDGSIVHKLTAETLVETLVDDPNRTRVTLKHGAARFSVKHNPRRVFEVQVGMITVDVLGTVFDVTRDVETQTVSVKVSEGLVRVLTAREQKVLRPGESQTFSEKVEEVVSVQPTPQTKILSGSTFQQTKKVEEADADKAVEKMLVVADEAKKQKQFTEAIAVLRQIIKKYPQASGAAYAAYDLGRILLDEQQRYGEAAKAFAQVESLRAHPELLENSLGREVEALWRSGEKDHARRRAQDYFSRYPKGGKRQSIEILLGTRN